MRTILFLFILSFSLFLRAQPEKVVFDIPIFAYHRFGDDRYPSTNISTHVFEEQLKFLKENKFEVITFGDAIKIWNTGETFPEKTAIITIDDGYLSFYTSGWPLLKKYGFPATIFIQTETVGGSDFINWKQIKEMQNEGIEIGNHSASHAYFVNLPKDELVSVFKNDLEQSSAEIEKHLGTNPQIYCYPYGEWTKEMEMILKNHGYTAAVVQKSGVFCEASSPYAIPRFPMGGPFGTLNGFKNKTTMKALRVERTNPDSPFFTENPPQLKVWISQKNIELKNAQFFVDGTKTALSQLNIKSEPPFIILKSEEIITARRTLYTLTAPSTDGKYWFWYSYLWIRPEVKE
ncbi:MAG: polysaccharide deacetylase family protein [Bacteroidales bacterium]|nr:polysaccharide deacetylase family protein [Bacteroidales bacterium]